MRAVLIRDLGEKGFVRWLGRYGPPAGRRDDTGIGDDAAVIRLEGGCDLLLACDAVVEGVHFQRELFSPADVGFKAVAVALSDIAAMGGEPLGFTVALGLPEDLEFAWVEGFYAGIEALTAQTGGYLAGGDTVRSPVLFADVAVTGRVEAGRAVRRAGARPGDLVLVTGEVGEAAAGLEAMQAGGGPGVGLAQRRPRPLLREGRLIAAAGATAMVDLSDGLAAGAVELALAGRVEIVLEGKSIPLGPSLRVGGAQGRGGPRGLRRLRLALYGGEDYQLLFTLPGERAAGLVERMRAATGTPLTVIGRVRDGEGAWLAAGGREMSLDEGYDPFRRFEP